MNCSNLTIMRAEVDVDEDGPQFSHACIRESLRHFHLHLHRRLDDDARLQPDPGRKRGRGQRRILVFELVERAAALASAGSEVYQSAKTEHSRAANAGSERQQRHAITRGCSC